MEIETIQINTDRCFEPFSEVTTVICTLCNTQIVIILHIHLMAIVRHSYSKGL